MGKIITSLLERGMDSARDDITNEAERTNVVEFDKAHQEFDAAINRLIKAVKRDQDLWKSRNDIECAMNHISSMSIWAGFRIGVTEGLKLANSVRALIGSEGARQDGP